MRRQGGRIVRYGIGWRSGRLAAAAMLAAAMVAMVFGLYPVERLRSAVFDIYQRIRPREAVSPGESPVLIVGIDEKSLQAFGRWPWPRHILADLTEVLVGSGARTVAFDFFFPEPDRSPAAC